MNSHEELLCQVQSIAKDYEAVLNGQVKGVDKEDTLKHLEAYCGQDTMGMVEILRVMKKLT